MLQAFTAIGQVIDDEPHQVDVTADFRPYRRSVEFIDCAETPIRPFIDQLDFITDKRRWGLRFRFGLFTVDEADFRTIRAAMTTRPAETGPAGL